MKLYKSLAAFYDEIFPLRQARLTFLDALFGDSVNRILDIGCGTGELALALADKGFSVEGIDLDETMIEAARKKNNKLSLNVKFQIKNMKMVGNEFIPQSFDAILCFGNTLAHLENLEVMESFFRGVSHVLIPGGIFIVQIVNFERILKEEIQELPLLDSENYIFRRVYQYDRRRHRIHFITSLTIKKRNEILENDEYLYPITHEELNRMLIRSGFTGIQYWGNDSMIPYSSTSPALIATAFKSI